MKSYMDLNVDPCNNFYDFACGNWEKRNRMPADRTTYDTFEMLRESLDGVLRDLLMETCPVSYRIAFLTTAVHFYLFSYLNQLQQTLSCLLNIKLVY